MKTFLMFVIIFIGQLLENEEIKIEKYHKNNAIEIIVKHKSDRQIILFLNYSYKKNILFIYFSNNLLDNDERGFTFKNGKIIYKDICYIDYETHEIKLFRRKKIEKGKKKYKVFYYQDGYLSIIANYGNGKLNNEYMLFDKYGKIIFFNEITEKNRKVMWAESGVLKESEDYREVRWLEDAKE